MSRVLMINGSYRSGGVTDQLLDVMTDSLRKAGAEVEPVLLRDTPIEFCLNCRSCTQQPGEEPGECVIDDGMSELVAKVEAADAFVLASPTNFSSTTAIFKRFTERLICYGDWPWGKGAPKYRKIGSMQKKAVLLSSSAAPGWMGRWLFSTRSQLRITAKVMGAKVAGILFTGMISNTKRPDLPASSVSKARRLALRLV